ncbi:hypothetical protein [[Actinomadura] parvosata]|uniref:hypothetical protein n=1 Tax=[Actinomadura] parvosata TaxID=1955412 RepID=UPI0016473D69
MREQHAGVDGQAALGVPVHRDVGGALAGEQLVQPELRPDQHEVDRARRALPAAQGQPERGHAREPERGGLRRGRGTAAEHVGERGQGHADGGEGGRPREP